MPSEFTLDLCFIREHAQSPFYTIIEQQMSELFVGKGTWYVDLREQEGLDIAVAEVKGLAIWESEADVLRYIEAHTGSGLPAEQDCWVHLQGYQVKVMPKADAGCCRLIREAQV
ncbi:hypothetical protein ASG89_22555 [Paenibacillus sp. Soil766]|uniref:hypothetical protein n=1 Tax=Paenibacillus sp. Soil766 TaxID=1736404 RepID=UPI00070EDE83|nr:hypothetical protein [Paenibacillus sp. Soil766]KRF04162.1 hypothetical protein ASG89_22555 [Paenibacillus sp. Soil766]